MPLPKSLEGIKEWKRKQRLVNLGKKQSKETIKKRVLKLKGKPPTKTSYKVGHIVTKEIRKKISGTRRRLIKEGKFIVQSMEKSPSWKGGKNIDFYGYVHIFNPKHNFSDCNGYIREHRLVMEKHLGRYLNPKEVVHHIDGDNSNNNIENLYLFEDNQKHLTYHRFLHNCVREMIKI